MRATSGIWRRFVVMVVWLALLTACGTPASSSHQPTPTATAPIVAPEAAAADDYLSKLADDGMFRGAVLLARDGVVLLRKGYGLADEARSIANTPQTRFRIGSITKSFTAMAILLLQERGKLHVRDHICRYVPDCPQDWQPITIEQLLTHTSGIPDYFSAPEAASFAGKPATPEQLVARFKQQPLLFPPGAQFSYSNSGYALVGYIIERVAGVPYGQFLEEQLFGPLQMRDSGYDTSRASLPQQATGYNSPHDPADYLDMSELYAAAGLYATVEDLERWDQAVQSKRLVSQEALGAMFAVHVPCPAGGCGLASDLGYGYGWFIARESGQQLIYHVGNIPGFLAFNGFYPAARVDVVVLSNLRSAPVLAMSTHLGAMVSSTPVSSGFS